MTISTMAVSTLQSEILTVSTLNSVAWTSNTGVIQSSLYVSSFSTLSGNFSTLEGSTIGVNTMDIRSTLTVSTIGIGTTDGGYRLKLVADSAYKPGTNTWATDSDQRLKEGIEFADLTSCYETVKSIPLRRYTWRDDVYRQHQFHDRSRLGWIAQEVEPHFPKAVESHRYVIEEKETSTVKEVIEDCRTLNTDQLYATMYGAIQRLIQKQEEMQEEIHELRRQLNQPRGA